ncbi:hypothetical protein ACH4XT_36945 [Streptomyces avidinii]|uniref:hypothetical protein n=1 Tax=Streptomyces avidinii TaxID=1895 RepID=UPI0037893958
MVNEQAAERACGMSSLQVRMGVPVMRMISTREPNQGLVQLPPTGDVFERSRCRAAGDWADADVQAAESFFAHHSAKSRCSRAPSD